MTRDLRFAETLTYGAKMLRDNNETVEFSLNSWTRLCEVSISRLDRLEHRAWTTRGRKLMGFLTAARPSHSLRACSPHFDD
jgi:hypothetical protein